MKRCDTCNAVYDDNHTICPTCGVLLTSLISDDREYGNLGSQNSGNTREEDPSRTATRNDSTYTFMQTEGSYVVFNGAVTESNTQQFYQSKFTKIVRAIFSSEPYQLSHTSYVTVFRLEEHSLTYYPEQAQDIVLFGGVQNVFAPGDDLTVRAKKRGNRYIAKEIYNHSINSNVRIEGNISAGIIQALCAALLFIIAYFIYGIAMVDYAAVGQGIMQFVYSLVPILVVVGLAWYIIKSFFRK